MPYAICSERPSEDLRGRLAEKLEPFSDNNFLWTHFIVEIEMCLNWFGRSRRDKQERAERAERERKATRPQSFAELKQVKEPDWNPVDQCYWFYPEGMSGMQFRVLASTSRESRLELCHPTGLRIRKVCVSRSADPDGKTIWHHERYSMGDIPFYFDGQTMGIVFESTITVADDEEIRLELPPNTEFRNTDNCGWYHHWTHNGEPNELVMSKAGVYTRGPRLRADH
jgi:hypothetical protein